MGRYSEKSTLRGSVYLLIEVQEGPEAVFDETGGRNFENFAVQPAGWPAGRQAGRPAGWPAGRWARRRAKTGPKPAETDRPAGQNRTKTGRNLRFLYELGHPGHLFLPGLEMAMTWAMAGP